MNRGTQASSPSTPHPLELYRYAVQDPETHAEVLRRMHAHQHKGAAASVLREDFAGTAADSVAWCAMGADRRALAIELDASTAAWAGSRAATILGEQAGRCRIMRADAMSLAPPDVPAADIISLLNFSIGYFRDRSALLGYLRHARRCLGAGGILVVNTFGGSDVHAPVSQSSSITPAPRLRTERAIEPFSYTWEQSGTNPVSGCITCRIHFQTSVGELRDAFVYEWRLWSLPELIDAAVEAGFSDAQAWRHTYDASRGADGVFFGPVESFDPSGLWTAYVVARAGGEA